MSINRKTASIVGILYIIGTVAGILSVIFTLPILGAPGYLSKIAANEDPIHRHHQFPNLPSGNGDGGMADREGIRSSCNR